MLLLARTGSDWLCGLVVTPTLLLCLVIGPVGGQELVSPAPVAQLHQWGVAEGVWKANGEELLSLEEALKEQGYYLSQLFLQYGENGTLSYEGLKALLGSLGLGEVSILEIRHPGHRHEPPLAPTVQPGDREHNPHHTEHRGPLPSPPQRRRLSEGDDQAMGSWEQPLDSSPERTTVVLQSIPEHPGKPPVLQPEEGRKLEIPLVFNHPTENHLHGNCLNVTQLLGNFGLRKESHITPAHFTFLCPALLYQIDSRVCIRHQQEGQGPGKERGVSFLMALGWGSLALTVISLPSLLALGTVPLLPSHCLHTLLCPLAALAVGTLCGDALLHLLPHAGKGSHAELQDAVLKGLCVLGGLYLFFLVESLLGLQRHRMSQRRKRERASSLQEGATERELTALQGAPPPDQSASRDGGGRAEQGQTHSHGDPAQVHAGISSLVWMVIMGDGIHNLIDGLAIGTAFSQSLAGGLSTTVAVFCHELPHELGDLAVLLSAGWPVRRVLLFSVLSAGLGFLGLLGGTLLSQHSTELSTWLFTLTAGVFLYVALTDMMPEMLRGSPGPVGALTRLLLQHLGLLMGGAIMLCIALLEDQITLLLA
ncbi:zinc transporter ZIP5 [Amia ocellicauda]|uniref:zinc transporter ZIP5 n=1 Tax=Amia ocellicauda TaxID=2972642 RepID=UPI0034643E6D